MRRLVRWAFNRVATASAVLLVATGAVWALCGWRHSAISAAFWLAPLRSSVVATTDGVSFTVCWPSYHKNTAFIASTMPLLYRQELTGVTFWEWGQPNNIAIATVKEASLGPQQQSWCGIRFERGFLSERTSHYRQEHITKLIDAFATG